MSHPFRLVAWNPNPGVRSRLLPISPRYPSVAVQTFSTTV
jgi:hypothetical protein